MARRLALAAAFVAALLPVSGAGGAPEQAPKRGGTVVVATNSFAEPACLAVWLAVCDSLFRAQFVDKVLARPFVEGPRALRSHLVERFELTGKPFAVTFHIRPQARWSDGVPVGARDFVFAYATYLRHLEVPPDEPFRTAIQGVQAVDSKTVRFRFRRPYANWLSLLNFAPLPRHVLRGVDLASPGAWRDSIIDPRTGRPIGSGPFLVESWEDGRQLTLVRNPRYWGRHTAYLDRVQLRFVRGPDTEQAMRTGQYDLGVVGQPAPQALQADSRFTTLPLLGRFWEHFEFRVDRGGHPALRSKLVRRALAYGIDRAALTRIASADPTRPVLDNTMILSNEPGYAPNWKAYRHRPSEARRLLEQAGCSRGAGDIYVCAEERLRLRFVTSSGNDFRTRTLEAAQRQLRRIGVEVEPVYASNALLFGTVLPSGDFDVALFNRSTPLADVPQVFRCRSPGGYCNRLVNADYEQLDRIRKNSRRRAVANRIDRRLAADVPAIPLYQFATIYVVRKGLRGVVPNANGALTTGGTLWNAENWWLDD